MRRISQRIVRSHAWVRHAGDRALAAHAAIVTTHPKTVMTVIALVTIVAVIGILRITVHNNYEADLPADDPIVQTKRVCNDAFGDAAYAAIGIVFTDGDCTSGDHPDVIRAVSQGAARLPGATSVTSIADTPSLIGRWVNDEWILTTTPLLDHTREGATLARRIIRRDRNFFESLVAPNYTATLIIVEMENRYDLQAPFNAAVAALKETHTRHDVQIIATGDLILNHETDAGIEQQIQRFFTLALILNLTILWYSFRSVRRGIIFPMLTIALGNCWTMGVIGWSGKPLNVVTSAIPVILTSITASYMIRILTAWDKARLAHTKTHAAVVTDAILALGDDIVKIALAAAFGAATLFAFPLASIRELGLFSAIGYILVMALTLTFLPACLVLFPGPPPRQKGVVLIASERRYLDWGRTVMQRPWLIIGTAVGVLAVSLIGISKLRVGVSWLEFFPKHHEVPETIAQLNEKFGWSYTMTMVVDTGQEGGVHDPEVLTALGAMDAAARARFPDVVHTIRSVDDVIRHVNRELHEGDAAADTIPEDAAANAELLLASALATSPGYFSGLVDPERRRAKCLVLLRDHDIMHIEDLYVFLALWAKNHFPPSVRVSFGGPAMLWVAQTRHIVAGKIANIVWSVVTIAVVGIVIFRSVLFGTLAVVPLILAILVTFGCMGWLGIRLNMATAIVTSMAVSFAVDIPFLYLHYAARFVPTSCNPLDFRVAMALFQSGRPIVVDTKANAAGFTTFLVSDFSPVRNFGWLTALNISLSAVASCTVLPALYTVLRGRREEAVFLRAQKQKGARDHPSVL